MPPMVIGDSLTVSTPSGKIIGIGVDVINLQGAKTYQFRRIPYAQPPVGDLRFAKPRPCGKWKGTLDATVFGAACMQLVNHNDYLLPSTDVSEDCLFLNVYVPNGIDQKKNKSVMVWIPGGGFVEGSGMRYDAEAIAVKGDVIVVTVNYRLHMFGFLSLGESSLKGNYGLWDQILALNWVHENIPSFGGDPNSVTLFGNSAGGLSVGLLAIIPSNKGLFQRVIAQSGVATSLLSTSPIGVPTTKEIGSYIGCTDYSPTQFISCLKSKSSGEILNATWTFINKIPEAMHIFDWIGPVVDNEVFTDSPANLLRNMSSEASMFFKSVDFMAGTTSSEGFLLIEAFTEQMQHVFNFNFSLGLPYSTFCENFVSTIVDDYYGNNSKVTNAIFSMYRVEGNAREQARKAVDMYTDLFFLSPTVSSLRAHAESNTQSTQYQYVLNKRSSVHKPNTPDWFRGVPHGTDNAYLFFIQTALRLNLTVSREDKTLSDAMIHYWTSFAKHG